MRARKRALSIIYSKMPSSRMKRASSQHDAASRDIDFVNDTLDPL